MRRIWIVAAFASLAVAVGGARQPEAPPVPRYKPTIAASDPAVRAVPAAGEPAARLAGRLARGEVTLAPDGAGDYLAAALTALGLSPDSQLLVFSKTSVQAAHITPARPRAVYFTDDVYVAHVPGTPGLEVVAVDPARGPVFYTLNTSGRGPPVLTPSVTCLKCHHGPNTAGVPGVYVGSVVPGPTGAPLRDDTAIITDPTTPFWERWGGWYVTARRGEPRTRANAVASAPNAPDALVREVPRNLATLHHFLDPRHYPRPTSDVVALLVLEHQTQVTNLITRVAWQARLVAAGARADRPDGLDQDVADLVDALLFVGEAPLAAPVEGNGEFTRAFVARGPRDAAGRSLRDFDLSTRLFRYPLSYLVGSPQLRALPARAASAVRARLHQVLAGEDSRARYQHLTPHLRTAIREIARATVPDLAVGW